MSIVIFSIFSFTNIRTLDLSKKKYSNFFFLSKKYSSFRLYFFKSFNPLTQTNELYIPKDAFPKSYIPPLYYRCFSMESMDINYWIMAIRLRLLFSLLKFLIPLNKLELTYA